MWPYPSCNFFSMTEHIYRPLSRYTHPTKPTYWLNCHSFYDKICMKHLPMYNNNKRQVLYYHYLNCSLSVCWIIDVDTCMQTNWMICPIHTIVFPVKLSTSQLNMPCDCSTSLFCCYAICRIEKDGFTFISRFSIVYPICVSLRLNKQRGPP